MNREIKFRAWVKYKNRMYQVESLSVGIICPDLIFVNDGSSIPTSFLKNETELMQYTGLKDKNGKEIYEGDIVKIDKKGWCGLKVIEWDEVKLKWPVHLRATTSHKSNEVIGNIYENPELLK